MRDAGQYMPRAGTLLCRLFIVLGYVSLVLGRRRECERSGMCSYLQPNRQPWMGAIDASEWC
jgi:hypothetical protein